jgi:hypothetical protein
MAASRVVCEEPIFAAPQCSCRHELSLVFAPESMGGLLLVLIAELIQVDFMILDRTL